jgi:hypothetical protein
MVFPMAVGTVTVVIIVLLVVLLLGGFGFSRR